MLRRRLTLRCGNYCWGTFCTATTLKAVLPHKPLLPLMGNHAGALHSTLPLLGSRPSSPLGTMSAAPPQNNLTAVAVKKAKALFKRCNKRDGKDTIEYKYRALIDELSLQPLLKEREGSNPLRRQSPH